VVSDSSFFAEGVPSIIYALRGLTYFELTVDGPGRDVHSGLYGGLVANPANALAKMIADMHDATGRVTIPGFYDDVVRPTDEELLAWSRLPFDQAKVAADLGLDRLAGGEAHLPALERCWARPTLDCNGIVGGYTAPGAKTIIPARASAKISMRLVANQDPERIVKAFQQFVAAHTPASIRATVCPMAKGRPVLLKTDSPAIRAARRAYVEAFGRDAVLIRCGASVPVTELIQRILGLEAVMMGFGLPDGRPHSPNERLSLQQVYCGAMAAAALLNNLAADAAG
jgi:acetylornithine deacetylase/succinyl-diaminopimelate desuccinylase-like protein